MGLAGGGTVILCVFRTRCPSSGAMLKAGIGKFPPHRAPIANKALLYGDCVSPLFLDHTSCCQECETTDLSPLLWDLSFQASVLHTILL